MLLKQDAQAMWCYRRRTGKLQVDDHLVYFLSGILGEELVRRLATKKVYFPLLWLLCSVFVGVVFMVLTLILFISDLYFDRAPDQSFIEHVRDFVNFHFILTQPWASLLYGGLGLMLAMAYRWHYHDLKKKKSSVG